MPQPLENPRAVIGGNVPPDPIDAALEPFGDVIDEAQTWLDGQKVTTEGQMLAVDVLIKGMKSARKALDTARDMATKPLHEAWKGEVARWKPTETDLDLQIKGLVALVDGFKRELAAEKAAEARRQWEAAEAAKQAAEALVAKADASDIQAQRDAMAALDAAAEARAQASAASKDTVKGMRKVTRYEITDHRALLNFIARNYRDDVTTFIEAWAAKNHKDNPTADGLRVWQDKEAY
jgi:hypothetical protein